MEKYTLIITEKPDAAKRIAMALDVDGNRKKNAAMACRIIKLQKRQYSCGSSPRTLIHDYKQRERSRDYPVFDYQWVPRYKAERGASRIRVWLKVIAQLAKTQRGLWMPATLTLKAAS